MENSEQEKALEILRSKKTKAIRTKFGSIKKDGFDSLFEKTIKDNLERMQKYYDFKFYYHDPRSNLYWFNFNKWSSKYKSLGFEKSEICGDRIHHIYEPDFLVDTENGSFLIESKGFLSSSDRTKMIEVKKQNPEIEIKFIFKTVTPLIGFKKPKTNVQWAIENGFDYSVGTLINKNWFK